MLCALSLFITFFATAKASATATDCSNGLSRFQITFLSLTPQTVNPGTDLTLGLLYTNPGSSVTDGTITNEISWNYIPFDPTIDPLCNSVTCPILNGSNNGTAVSTWPDLTGLVTSKVTWKSITGDILLCIQMDVMTGTKDPNPKYEIIETRFFRNPTRPSKKSPTNLRNSS